MRTKWLTIGVLTLLIVSLAACDSAPTPQGSRDDATSAQAVMPNLAGYTSVEAQSVADALALIAGGGSLATGNIIGALAVNRINAMISCYQNVGAVTARIYASVQNQTIGALAVVNEDRLAQNLVACAVNPDGGFGAQSAQEASQPCAGSGSFTYRNERFTYVYAASDISVCNLFNTHFNNLNRR